MPNIFTQETIAKSIEERKLRTGDRLWVAGDIIDQGPYRQGNSASNAAVYLRWRDLNKPHPGKINDDEMDKVVIEPKQGLSLFIEKIVTSDFHYIGDKKSIPNELSVSKYAKEKGYDNHKEIHWFRLRQGSTMPSGLEIIFDNDPPGHCTLTVTRSMTVREFISLVESVGFDYVGADVFGKESPK